MRQVVFCVSEDEIGVRHSVIPIGRTRLFRHGDAGSAPNVTVWLSDGSRFVHSTVSPTRTTIWLCRKRWSDAVLLAPPSPHFSRIPLEKPVCRNSIGQLGNGSRTSSSRPVPVRGLSHIVSVASGFEYGLAVRDDGTAWGWGAILRVNVAMAGGGAHSLAIDSDGSVWGWGNNSDGQVGCDDPDTAMPARVIGIDHAVAVAAGGAHSLARKSDGTVWGWGANGEGDWDPTARPASRFSSRA
ncbi:MAG TPA: hypothetical protein VMH81_33595 [Bryobacteraceae bacterium]|nr:hypothetical protein [Bryobacteraceae bacterium]